VTSSGGNRALGVAAYPNDGGANAGKVVAAGFISSPPDIVVVRTTSTGVPDPTFGVGGVKVIDLGAAEYATSVRVLNNGKLLLAGFRSSEVIVARLTASGALDQTFGGGDGWADTGFLSTVPIRAGLAVQNDGKILVSADHLGNFAVARFDASGTLDSGFGTGGKVVVDLPALGAVDHANAVTVVPANLLGGGKIVAAGVAEDGVEANFAVARFLPDGTLDASFGSNGVTIVDASGTGGYDAANAVALEVDGLGVKVVVAGSAQPAGSGVQMAVVRLSSTGLLDPSFSGDGVALLNVGAGVDEAEGVAVQLSLCSSSPWCSPQKSKVVLTGFTGPEGDQRFALVRLKNDGTLDTSFSFDGVVTTNPSAGDDRIWSLVLSAGKAVVAGQRGTQFALARYRL
jgi:uncharacterized delta-60 repeat protein